MYSLIIFVLLVKQCSAVNYFLNESDYNKMPALYGMDEFDSCLLEPGGVYCLVDVELHADPENDLMMMIKGYSDYSMKHFNHTVIHRGVCATKTCKSFTKIDSTNTTVDLNATLEGCLNDSLWRNYGLQGRVAKIEYCKRDSDVDVLDTSDTVVAIVYLVLIVLNVIGTSYDEFLWNPYLLAFSIRRNWRKMVAPSGVGSEPRLERLKLFHGLRSMTMVCVFFAHTMLLMSYSYLNNPHYIETLYDDPFKQILLNGSLVTHTFFVMSSFLLAYNFQLYQEKHKVSWVQFPKGVLHRWLRLTPVYALILATIATLMRHAGHGPLWDWVVVTEANACRQYWWAHVLYINNYVYDDAYCTPQTWYLAADTQMFCLGLLICVVARGPLARKVVLSCLFVASLVISAAHTYFQDLDAVVIQSPEKFRNLYATDKTFRLRYICAHTNLSTYTLGLAGGFLTYHWQKEGKDFSKYRKHRWVIWLIFPVALGVILSGGLFYMDGAPPSTALRVLYATFYKPIFQAMVVILIIATVFKIESVYRTIVEWPGFTPIGRLSYSGFLIHTMIQRGLGGIQDTPLHMSDYYVLIVLAATTLLSYLLAGVLWIFVESPAAALTKAVLDRPRTENSKVYLDEVKTCVGVADHYMSLKSVDKCTTSF